MKKIIKSLKELKELTLNTEKEIAVVLNYGLFSRKVITYTSKKFHILNCIDNTTQVLTGKQIMDKKLTNIGHAIGKKALVLI